MTFRFPRVWLISALLLALPACDDSEYSCENDDDCTCTGGDDCYLACEGDGCRESCSDLVNCGGVCDNHCDFDCHSLNDCSVACGDYCAATCRDAVSCEAIQGIESSFVCEQVNRCGAEVGDGSRVRCSNMTSCVVLCHGDCDVECDEVGRPCEVYCGSRDAQPQRCASGTSCGC